MKTNFNINFTEFNRNCEAAIGKVKIGTDKATESMCKEILEDSLNEVPRDTSTLANSAFYKITSKALSTIATVGYGGNGDPTNKNTGRPSSEYMVVVHEDLSANHPIGKAKYLEDPIRRYEQKLPSKLTSFFRNIFK